ncbi:MAG: hypothetical protein HYV63_34755 [Candidatus Schekmanbacteria bacterium]|nr:hypothetical protein [Candidatus Schekmanbacteria bacterium]
MPAQELREDARQTPVDRASTRSRIGRSAGRPGASDIDYRFVRRAFAVVTTIELVVEMAGEETSVRLDVMQDLANENRFKASLLRQEMFTIQPSFPSSEDGQPLHPPCCEAVWVEAHWTTGDEEFELESPDVARAVRHVMSEFARHPGFAHSVEAQ